MNTKLELKDVCTSVFTSALESIDPEQQVANAVAVHDQILSSGDQQYELTKYKRIRVVAFGKAAPQMVRGLELSLGELAKDGIVLSHAFLGELPAKYRCYTCTHPLPTQANIAASAELLALLKESVADTLVVVLVSGGGSSILCSPAAGITLEEKSATSDLLMKAGASISELNTVRKALSNVKGGKLSHATTADVLALYLSDVPGDDLSVVASGPTVESTVGPDEAYRIIEAYDLVEKIPTAVAARLRAPESKAEQVRAGRRIVNQLVGRNLDMLNAIGSRLRDAGFEVEINSDHFEGYARDLGKQFAEKVIQKQKQLTPGARYAFLQGGETTVNVTGDGLGGRNSEVALAAAITLAGRENCALLAAGTDGKDGPTEAAGAVADGLSVPKMEGVGVVPMNSLQANDTHSAFAAIGDAVVTGPTGTNLMDVVVMLAQKI